MSRKLKLLIGIIPLAILLLTAGCKTKRASLKKPLKEYGFDYLYKKMLQNQMDFEYLSAKMDITYLQGKNKTELNGQLRMRKDSIMWLSFSPALGIEAGRLLLTNDSVKFLNRLNKTYFTGRYGLLDSLLNTSLDFSILQSMLLGNDLAQYDISRYRSSIDGGLYRITILERRKLKKHIKRGENRSGVLVQQIWLDPETFRIRRIDIKELGRENHKLQVFYDDYKAVNGHLFPTYMNIKITSSKPIHIEVKYSRVTMEGTLKYPFRIPRKYERLL